MTITRPQDLIDPPSGGDSALSPITGWTRRTWTALADAALLAVQPYASPDHARIDLPGPASWSGRDSDGLEGFARTFLLAGFRLSADGADDPGNLAEWYAAGLVAGTDPDNPGRWPSMDEAGQAKVECASIALALHETRRWIWDRLDDPARQRIVAWLSRIGGSWVPENNWVWFRAVTAAFLRSAGATYQASDIEYAQARTEEWYAGEGWYSDGQSTPGRQSDFDYYNGWAMHFYPLWYGRISGPDADADLADRYRSRLSRYLADAQHLIARDGTPVLQGRSLTYRYAMLAPFWAGAVFDATPLAPGLTRRLASGVVRRFVRNGCFNESGIQELGWNGAFPPVRQVYSGPGSPYWSSKGFAGLVLPADHPVWTAAEQPTALDRGKDVGLALAVPGWIVSATADDGIVRVAAHGPDHSAVTRFEVDDEVYARHGYSSHASPLMTDASRTDPLDSHVCLLTGDGRASHRRPNLPVQISGRIGVSRHRAHWLSVPAAHPARDRMSGLPHHLDLKPEDWAAGPWLTTASVLRGALEVRLARVDPAAETDALGSGSPMHPGPWRLRFGGWAVPATGPASALLPLRGSFGGATSEHPDAIPLAAGAHVPSLQTADPVAFGEVYAVAVILAGDVHTPDQTARAVRLEVTPDPAGAEITLAWPDGERDRFRLDPPRLAAPAVSCGS
jgi:hypothetical protein